MPMRNGFGTGRTLRATRLSRSRCHIWSMPLPDLPDDERAELVRLVRDAIAGERYLLSPRMKRLKSLLAWLDPSGEKPAVTPYPAPKPSTEPSLLYRKMRGGGRHRH